ncbi:winged helix-turn-helix transcriptional regulator [Nonomuraea antimicrobica]
MGKAYNIMAATCPSRTVLHRIGARWTVFIVNALDNRPMRFTELKAHIRGSHRRRSPRRFARWSTTV